MFLYRRVNGVPIPVNRGKRIITHVTLRYYIDLIRFKLEGILIPSNIDFIENNIQNILSQKSVGTKKTISSLKERIPSYDRFMFNNNNTYDYWK